MAPRDHNLPEARGPQSQPPDGFHRLFRKPGRALYHPPVSETSTSTNPHWDGWTGAPVRRLGALGDIHGAVTALKAALATFQNHDVDLVVAVGDVVDGPEDVGACIDVLRKEDVLTIQGNHERWFLENSMRSLPHATMELNPGQRAFLLSCPKTARLPTVTGALIVCHGVGTDDLAVLKPSTRGYDLQPAIEAVRSNPSLYSPDVFGSLGGHTHERMVRKLDPLWFFNAGTLLPDPDPGFVILDFERREVETYDLSGTEVTPGAPIPF